MTNTILLLLTLVFSATAFGNPYELNASLTTSRKVYLEWKHDATKINSLRIQRSVNGSSYSNIAKLSTLAYRYTDYKVQEGQNYKYRIYYGIGYSNEADISLVQSTLAPDPTTPAPTTSSLWRMGYYPGWVQTRMPPSEVDMNSMSHIFHFSLLPNSDGSLNSSTNMVTISNIQDLIGRAHSFNVKVLITVGCAETRNEFLSATNSTNRAKFITNIVNFVRTYGYDGVDIDWEPMETSDFPQYSAFITALHAELVKISPKPLLTAAVLQSSIYAPLFRDLQSYFDRINIMTYDLSGPWQGWVSWHNSALFDGGFKFPTVDRVVPSADLLVKEFAAAGIPKSKLGIGMGFYGWEWRGGSGTSTGGVTQPRQSWSTAPQMVYAGAYWEIMENSYNSTNYRWDDIAKVPYLSFDYSGSSSDRLISYENEDSVYLKTKYAMREQLGSVIIWQLENGYFTSRPAGFRDPLLQSMKKAFLEGP